jgi:hypothetical protein
MALSRNLQVLELSGLRLDQPLTHCGELNSPETRLVSEARFHAVGQAFQAALDRRVDLVVLHSEILSDHSTGGRTPWFLGRLIESYHAQGIPILWAEPQHNAWMERYVPSPANLVRLVPGEVHRLVTSAGPVLLLAGHPARDTSPLGRDATQVTIGLHCGAGVRHDIEVCDLVLRERLPVTDRIEDFVATTREDSVHPLATLHTVRPDRSNTRESLAVSPLGYTCVACSLSSQLTSESLPEHLSEEVDAAAGRYYANHPQTQLLIVDLTVTGHGAVWDSLWSSARRESLVSGLARHSRHPGCRVRTISPLADGSEVTRNCPFTPVLQTIWSEVTDHANHEVRSLADIVPDSFALGDWARGERIPVDHPLAAEVRHACLHLLRSAS